MNCYLEYIQVYIGDQKIEVTDYVNQLDCNIIEYVRNELEIDNLDKEDIIGFMKYYLERDLIYLFEKERIDVYINVLEDYVKNYDSNIEVIILANNYNVNYRMESNISYELKKRLKLKNCIFYAIDQECSAGIMALKHAEMWINSGMCENVVVITDSVMSDFRINQLEIISDAVGICKVSTKKNGIQLVDYYAETDGTINERNIDEIVLFIANCLKKIAYKSKIHMKQLNFIIIPSIYNKYNNELANLLGICVDNIKFHGGDFGYLGNSDFLTSLLSINKKNGFAAIVSVGSGMTLNEYIIYV